MTLLLTPEDERKALAQKIAALKDVRLPELRYWNTEPCRYHDEPKVDCEYRLCGGELFAHQRVGISWAYVAKKGLLADEPGLGKTNVILGLIALLKQKNELTNRAVIIVQTPSVLQWGREAHRWLPAVHVEAITGAMPKSDRLARYASNWDVLVIGFHVALKDEAYLDKLGPFSFVASDDVDPLLDHDNRTHDLITKLSLGAERSLTINATVLQTRLEQLHAALAPSGGIEVFGPLQSFKRKYVRTERVTLYKQGKRISANKMVGYKNLNHLKEKLRPLVLRRRADEVDDIRIPTLMPPTIEWLEFSPRQKQAYADLQKQALTLIKDGQATKAAAEAKFMYGQMICAGLPALGEEDGPGASPKLDWIMQRLTTVWADRKIVVFCKNVGMVRALEARCVAKGIGVAKVWGQSQNAVQRQQEIDRFWNDPRTRVLVGTTAVERSLNLQVANILVFLDIHTNPARVKQILGRVKRAGSKFKHVYMFTLYMAGSQEEHYEHLLSERQAVSDAVFEEESEIHARLNSIELLRLITP